MEGQEVNNPAVAETDKDNNAEPDYKALYEAEKTANGKLKANLDKANNDYAAAKKAEKERMTDDERKNAETAELQQKYADAQKRLNKIEAQNRFAKNGFDEKDYSDLSDKLVEACGDNAPEVAELIVKFANQIKTKTADGLKRDSLLGNTVRPNGQSEQNSNSAAKLAERIAKQAAQTDSDKIKALYK